MNNAMQLKALIKNIAKSKNISAQIILQNYMLERLLERITESPYQSNFILKGGFLIAAMVGLDIRATMDMDATIKELPATAESISNMLQEICDIEVNDDVTFSVRRIEKIREGAEHNGFRVALEALYPPMAVPLKIDITTGDKITPREVTYEFRLLLEPRSIKVLAYNLETIVAEKLETVIARGDQNTRPRDYYDIYVIRQLQWKNVDPATLGLALKETCQNRGTSVIMERYREILSAVENSKAMNKFWRDYQAQFDYAKDIEFKDICLTIQEIMNNIVG